MVKSIRNEVKAASFKINKKIEHNSDNENVPDYSKTIAKKKFNDSYLAKKIFLFI